MTTASAALLQMKSIHKSFPGVRALHQVDFELQHGEVHALLGANGAGKSTLMKILSGAYRPDQGSIELEGRQLSIQRPLDAIASGIQCVYQEVDTALVPTLTVAENIMLDQLTSGKGWISWGSMRLGASRVLTEIGLAEFDVTLPVKELTIAQKQLVLIARALVQKAKVIIFDEPTAPLSGEEAEQLFRIIERLRQDGVGCIFISHRLSEVFRICDRITILRDGQRVTTRKASELTAQTAVEQMLGKPFEEEFPKLPAQIGRTVLDVRGVTSGTKVRNVSLTVREGEIVGIVGLVGAGKTELSRVLFGADPMDQGELLMNGQRLKLSEPADAVKAGLALVPEERRKQGVLVDQSIRANLALPLLKYMSRWGFVSSRRETENAEERIAELGVQPPHAAQLVKYLSGGNQQKVAVGKWLPTDAQVYLFDEPTKGVDVGAKSDIFRLIGKLAQAGKGIIYFSCEISEILGIADRILVMSYGQIVKELRRDEATQETILFYASSGEAY
jgi:simple sugar transport system ATP-binding protein